MIRVEVWQSIFLEVCFLFGHEFGVAGGFNDETNDIFLDSFTLVTGQHLNIASGVYIVLKVLPRTF